MDPVPDAAEDDGGDGGDGVGFRESSVVVEVVDMVVRSSGEKSVGEEEEEE